MRFFDPHIHMTSRTTDDYEAMAAAGVRAVIEPAFWLGQPRTTIGSFVDYFSSLVGWERFRAANFGIAHYCTIGLNSKEANDEGLAREVLELVPRFAFKQGVVAIGEIGYDEITAAEEHAYQAQLEFARENDMVVMVHSPHRDKKSGIRRSIDVAKEVGVPMEKLVIDHNNEETVDDVLDAGAWGRLHDLPAHQDGLGAHGRDRQEVRSRAHHRRQLRRLGRLRRTRGPQDRQADARARRRPGVGREDDLAERPRRLRAVPARSTSKRCSRSPASTRANSSTTTPSCAARPRAWTKPCRTESLT